MWFLWFYSISTGIILIILFILANSIRQKLKRENIKIKTKHAFSEVMSALLPFLIPFLNIILIIVGIFSQEKIYKKVKNNILKGE